MGYGLQRGRVVFVKRRGTGAEAHSGRATQCQSLRRVRPLPHLLLAEGGPEKGGTKMGGDLNRISGDHGEAEIISQAPKIAESKSN